MRVAVVVAVIVVMPGIARNRRGLGLVVMAVVVMTIVVRV